MRTDPFGPADHHSGRTLGVVVINWNGRKHLTACLDSLYASERPPDHIVVVDNGSSDGSVAAVREQFGDVHVVENDTNLGFARANNQGGEIALEKSCDHVLFLNNDAIVDRDCLGQMMTAAAEPGVAIVNPLIEEAAGKIWFAGARVDWRNAQVDHTYEVESFDSVYDIESATGCALLTSAQVVAEFGPFDERYFIYFEDAELSAAIRRLGRRIVLQPSAVVRHMVSADSLANSPTGFFYYLNTRNRLIFARGQLTAERWAVFVVRYSLCYVLPRAVALVLLGRGTKARALFRGYLDFFRGRVGPPRLG